MRRSWLRRIGGTPSAPVRALEGFFFAAFFGETLEGRPWAIKREDRRAGFARRSFWSVPRGVQLLALEIFSAFDRLGDERSQNPSIHLLLLRGGVAGLRVFGATGAAAVFGAG
jgi:hypothetical protein